MLWQFLPKKYELNGWIRHSDWHWLSEAVPSIMVQSCWWGSQIIDQKKSGCCRWLTFVQDEWFTGHTSYLHAKWSICFGMLWQAFPLKMWLVWVEVSPGSWERDFKTPCKFHNQWDTVEVQKITCFWGCKYLLYVRKSNHTHSHTSLTFVPSKMGLNTFLAQRLWWNVKMLGFSEFGPFFLKYAFLMWQHYFMLSTYPVKSFFQW